MARRPRELLPSEIVHITIRGIGRRIIFDDAADKDRFLETFASKLDDMDVSAYAWCLMENHVHLLLHGGSADLSKLMQRLEVSYAQYFNGRHGHVGKVFQNRFGSQAVCSEPHLLSAIRYIHRNPLEAGAANLTSYPWSSYREIAGMKRNLKGAGIVDVETVLSLFGGAERFVDYHEEKADEEFVWIDGYRPRLEDVEAMDRARRLLGDDFSERICTLPKGERNEWLASLKSVGLSIRQIERFTGIGRGIIARA